MQQNSVSAHTTNMMLNLNDLGASGHVRCHVFVVTAAAVFAAVMLFVRIAGFEVCALEPGFFTWSE